MDKNRVLPNLRGGLSSLRNHAREVGSSQAWSLALASDGRTVVLSVRSTPESQPTVVELAPDEAKALARALKTIARAGSNVEELTFIPQDILELPAGVVASYLRAQKLEPVLKDAGSGEILAIATLAGDEQIVSIDPPAEQQVRIGSLVVITICRR